MRRKQDRWKNSLAVTISHPLYGRGTTVNARWQRRTGARCPQSAAIGILSLPACSGFRLLFLTHGFVVVPVAVIDSENLLRPNICDRRRLLEPAATQLPPTGGELVNLGRIGRRHHCHSAFSFFTALGRAACKDHSRLACDLRGLIKKKSIRLKNRPFFRHAIFQGIFDLNFGRVHSSQIVASSAHFLDKILRLPPKPAARRCETIETGAKKINLASDFNFSRRAQLGAARPACFAPFRRKSGCGSASAANWHAPCI
jgi:hypothetical protein